MRVAILGWGSLIWDPQGLPREGIWEQGGPKLPIEFSRISNDCRLTLVIDETHGEIVSTRFVLSTRVDLEDAAADLRGREKTSSTKIGYLDLGSGKQQSRSVGVREAVSAWAASAGFQAVVWTDLEPNFKCETGIEFSLDAAVVYLQELPKSAATRARKYIVNAPTEVNTPLRRRLREIGWL